MAIRIVTDSTARFTVPNFLERYPVAVAPMTIRSGSTIFQERSEPDRQTFEQLFSDPRNLPLCEAPSEETLARLYGQLARQADQILSIHTSAQISPVVQHAEAASQRHLGRVDIQVIDSETFSAGLGLLVEAAAQAAEAGADFDSLVRLVRGLIPRLYCVFAMDELEYLQHNGLITRSQAILGSMLGIITFLTVEEGTILPMEKVRTKARAIEKLVEFVSEFTHIEHMVLLHELATPADEMRILMDRLRSLYPATPITVRQYGPSVATFVGTRGLGVVVLEAEET